MSLLLASTSGEAPFQLEGVGGIASVETFGQPRIGARVALNRILTAEAFGSPAIGAGIELVGIESAEAFGQPYVSAQAEEVSEVLAGRHGGALRGAAWQSRYKKRREKEVPEPVTAQQIEKAQQDYSAEAARLDAVSQEIEKTIAQAKAESLAIETLQAELRQIAIWRAEMKAQQDSLAVLAAYEALMKRMDEADIEMLLLAT